MSFYCQLHFSNVGSKGNKQTNKHYYLYLEKYEKYLHRLCILLKLNNLKQIYMNYCAASGRHD